MKRGRSFISRCDGKLDYIGEYLKGKEVTLPTDLVGAALFMGVGAVLLAVMPDQVLISNADVVNGRVFPAMLTVFMIACSGILVCQNLFKMMKKKPVHTCTLNMLTEVKALIILAILCAAYIICRITDLFVCGAVFCCFSFLLYFRCGKKLTYLIAIGLAVVIWGAFRFGLGVRF